MNIITSRVQNETLGIENVFQPIFYRLANKEDKKNLEKLLEDNSDIQVYDELDSHLRELIKIQNPQRKIKSDEYPALIEAHLNGRDRLEYGVWVYYPWSGKVVHLLDEEEFVEVRTNRNRYKLTKEEQQLLAGKKIGVIGLSVGQSIALTIAIERICGELRLADFDVVELSNLNRIRTGVHNLCLKKTILAAREIYEIDPFLKVKVFNDGVTKDNIDEFFTSEGKLDLLVEVCDGLDIKIISRFKARELQVPVVMDTNDRGMLDVERFDLEPDRPILHGLAGDLDPEKIKNLTNEEKIPYILKMVGAETISTRLKASMMEVEQSINTWPQLASSVTLGGALTTDTARRILMDQYHESGRFYIDFEELLPDKPGKIEEYEGILENPHKPLTEEDIKQISEKYLSSIQLPEYIPDEKEIDEIVKAILSAPSAGNNQPWKWYYRDGVFILLHDKYKSWSWGDYDGMGAFMGLGCAIEGVSLQGVNLGLKSGVQTLPDENEPRLIAAITFEKSEHFDDMTRQLAEHMFERCTNRKLDGRKELPTGFVADMHKAMHENSELKLYFTKEANELDTLGEIMAACDRIRLLHPQGHKEFYSEVRWSKEHAEETRDGIELAAVDLSEGDKAGFYVAQDYSAVSLLSKWNKGTAFRKFSEKTMKSAGGALLMAIPEFRHINLINSGRDVYRVWILANMYRISVHPMLSPVFFFSRLVVGKAEGMPDRYVNHLKELRQEFLRIFPLNDDTEREYSEIFLMKLAIADDMGIKALRRHKKDIFYRG